MAFSKKLRPKSTGDIAECTALKHLQKQGLKLVAQNYRCRRGEIDLIMEDGNTLVFVEVRYRKNNHFGEPVETVNTSKQQRIRLTAQHYLLNHDIGETRPSRCDIVGISPDNLQWIKNAF